MKCIYWKFNWLISLRTFEKLQLFFFFIFFVLLEVKKEMKTFPPLLLKTAHSARSNPNPGKDAAMSAFCVT